MLCSVCQGLPPLAEFPGVEPHHALPLLQISAQNGCELCVLIWQALAPLASVQIILEGKAEQPPEEAQVTLDYGPASKLQLDRYSAQYIWVNPSVYTGGGARLELFLGRGKQLAALSARLVVGFIPFLPCKEETISMLTATSRRRGSGYHRRPEYRPTT